MFVALSFIGKLPEYILDCIHQIRLFYDGKIVLILDDLNSPYLPELTGKYMIDIVNYNDVLSPEFIHCYNQNKDKFMLLPWLKDRELLFIRCFERFFLLGNAMKKHNLTDCFFMELDNLIYDDPRVWLSEFQKWKMCFMFDHHNRAASGVMYIKDSASMDGLLEYMIEFINQWEVDPEVWLSEMAMLYGYYLSSSGPNLTPEEFGGFLRSDSGVGKATRNPLPTVADSLEKSPNNEGRRPELFEYNVQFMPTFWSTSEESSFPSIHFDKYNNTIFDAAAIGIMLYGFDTGDKDKPRDIGTKSKYSLLDYTPYKLVWKTDEKNRLIPYFYIDNNYIKINNLHVHCKNLAQGLSFPR